MSIKFSQLPEDCVQLVFSRIPTQILLSTVRLVCQYWNAQHQLNCRIRKTLVLLSGESAKDILLNSRFERNLIPHRINQDGLPMNWSQYFDRYQVKARTLTRETVNSIVSTFPMIHTLIAAHQQYIVPGTTNPLAQFLSAYSHQLKKLKLYLNYQNDRSPNPSYWHIDQLVKRFNSLTNLEHLTLECTNPMVLYLPHKEMLKFMTRIKQFNCYMPMMPRVWFECLRELEQEGRLAQIEQIGFASIDLLMHPFTFEISPWPVSARFTRLPSSSWIDGPISLEALVNFPSLSTLSICCSLMPESFAQLSKSLQPLNKLVHISLQLNQNWLSIQQPVNPKSHKLQPVPSVKALDLRFHEKIALGNFYPSMTTLASMFPNVQTIRFVDLRDKSYFWTYSYSQEDVLEGGAIAFLSKLKAIFGQHIRTLYCSGEDYEKD